jgi:hypothetical protein
MQTAIGLHLRALNPKDKMNPGKKLRLEGPRGHDHTDVPARKLPKRTKQKNRPKKETAPK